MINMKHIAAIMAIVHEGSVTAASKKLFVSQPALSQVVKSVEQDLGAVLFERNGTGLRLTHAGELYMQTAQKMLDLDRTLHAQVAASTGEIYGEIHMGISVQRGLQILPRLIPAFYQQYPHVKIKLCEEGSTRLERMLLEGMCDIAFITTTQKRNPLEYVLIESEKLVLIAAKTTKLAQKYPDGTPLQIAEARNELFVSMAVGHSVRSIQDRLFEEYGIHPGILLETHNMEAAKSVAAHSGAVFLVPSVYAGDTMANRNLLNIYPIRNQDYERHFFFCYRRSMALTQYEKDLVRMVCEQLKVPFLLEGKTEQ